MVIGGVGPSSAGRAASNARRPCAEWIERAAEPAEADHIEFYGGDEESRPAYTKNLNEWYSR